MQFNIYKELIEDSPISYLHIKLEEDNLGNFTALEVKNYNKAYERALIAQHGLDKSIMTKLPEDEVDMERWKNFFAKVKENRKSSAQKYIESAKSYFNIDVYYAGDNEYHLRLSKISSQQIKLSSVLKNAPFYVWVKDRNGVYIDVNQRYLDFLDKTYDEVVGKTSFDLLSKERAEKITKEEEEVMKQKKTIVYMDTITQPERIKGHYEVYKWPYMDKEESMVLGTLGMVIDSTENVNLRRKLEATEKQFLEIANNINDIIVIRDEQKAHYINPAFEKIYKFKPDELYEDMNKWYEHWDEVVFENEPKDYSYEKHDTCTFRVSKKGQEDIWLWNRFVPIFDEEGNLIKKIGVISDITEQKKIQSEIDRIKMDFLANISHELRTPINLILSSLQVLNIKIDKLDIEAQEFLHRYIEMIGQNGRRLLKLVNNLIDTTRLDAGCFNYVPRNYDIVKCVEDICESTATFVESNNLEIIFDTDQEEKVVSFDFDNMERIILNLISNAIKFNKQNGKIEVTISCKKDIQIIVKDTGIGIPDDKLESIFGRFEQVKNKFKKEREGSGIGLSLVKSLVEIQGGSIDVNSKVGEGSEFIITLPDILVNEDDEGADNYHNLTINKNRLNIELSDIYFS
ncbi:MAG: PAS domain-containing sensor histidine kinase [Peptostreptococcaceae bacterium]